MAGTVGTITGQMLETDLQRDGVDLAFDTDLIYLDVVNGRIGVKSTIPTRTLLVNGTIRSTFLTTQNNVGIANILLSPGTISNDVNNIYLSSFTDAITTSELVTDGIRLNDNVIDAIRSNENLDLTPSGTGKINLYNNTEVFGNLHATGNVTFDGNLTFGNDDTDSVTINADIASNILPDAYDTYNLGTVSKRWNNLDTNLINGSSLTVSGQAVVQGIDLNLRQGNIWYVGDNGGSSNFGDHPQDPFDKISDALAVATSGDTVYIYPGTYYETLPLIVPVGVTVKGFGIRSVNVRPDTSSTSENVFLLNGESTVEDLTISDYYYNSINDTGYAFAFAANMTVTSRSPYIRNVTVITKGSVLTVSDPRGYNQGDAGRGAKIDGSVVNINSKEASMLFHSVTFITPGVRCISMTNGVRVEWLNCFIYFSSEGLYAVRGSSGFAGDGKTRLKIYGISAQTLSPGNTVSIENVSQANTYTVATIESVSYSGAYTNIVIDGYISGFETSAAPPDTSNQQRIFFSGGQTASYLEWVDYGDFGAEVRSIGSANVYGNIGAKADGEGTIMYLITHNFGYIGSGRFSTNDTSNTIPANETIELNGGKIYYQSMDHKGDFKVGDIFKVESSTGRITFQSNLFSGNNLTITDGVNVSYIDANEISTGNLTISGNTIQSNTGSIILNAANTDLDITSNFRTNTNLTVTGTTTLRSQTTFGDSVTDTIFFTSEVASNFIPDINSLSLGTISQRWKTLYATNLTFDNIVIDTNYISTTLSNSNLQLDANGQIYFDSITFTNNTISTLSNQDLVINPNGAGVVQLLKDTAVTGNLSVSGNASVGGNVQIGDLYLDTINPVGRIGSDLIPFINSAYDIGSSLFRWNNVYIDQMIMDSIIIDTNVIQSIESNANLELRTNGTGSIRVDQLDIKTNTISSNSTNANININPNGVGVIRLQKNTQANTNFIANSTVTLNGNLVVGDSNTDTIIFNSRVITDVLPLQFPNTIGYYLRTTNSSTPSLYQISFSGDNLSSTSDISISKTNYDGQDVSTALNLIVAGSKLVIYATQFGNINQYAVFDVTSKFNLSSYVIYLVNYVGQVGFASDTWLPINQAYSVGYFLPGQTVSFSSRYDLGQENNRWNTIFLDELTIDDIVVNTNYIASTNSNANLELRANATGRVIFEQVTLKTNQIGTDSNTDLLLTPNGTGIVQLQKNTSVLNNLTVSGSSTFNANTQIGDTVTDTINVKSRAISDLLPNLTATYELGLDSLRWNNIYLDELTVDDLTINTNFIRSNISNSNLEFTANGVGRVLLADINVNDNQIGTDNNTNLIVNPNGTAKIQLLKNTVIGPSTNRNLLVTGNSDFLGNTVFSNLLFTIDFKSTFSSDLLPNTTYDLGGSSLAWSTGFFDRIQVGDKVIDTNIIQSTESNANLEIQSNTIGYVSFNNITLDQYSIGSLSNNDLTINPDGTGKVQLQANTNITGNLSVSGTVNYNGNLQLGDSSSDNFIVNARIISDLLPDITALRDIGSANLRWNSVYLNQLVTDSIIFDTNIIQSTESNANLILRSNGTGFIRLDQLDVTSNLIFNSVINTNINLNPNGIGIVQLLKNTNISGNLTVSGTNALNGDLQLGDSSSDTVRVNSRIISDLLPSVNTGYNLGLDTNRWNTVYLDQLNTDSIIFDTNIIQSTESNANLEFRANGVGRVLFEDININDNQIGTDSNTDIQIAPAGPVFIQLQKNTIANANFSVSSTSYLKGNLQFGDSSADSVTHTARIISDLLPSISSSLDLGLSSSRWNNVYLDQLQNDAIVIDTNIIQNTESNSNLEFNANGTGFVIFEQVNLSNNTISTYSNTDIIINPNGIGTVQLQKSTSITGNLTVTNDITVGGNVQIGDQNIDTINVQGRISSNLLPNFTGIYDLGTRSVRWNTVYLDELTIDDIVVNTNYIASTSSNANLELRANGLGAIRVDQLDFKNNSIISNATNSNIIINPNGSGSIQLLKNTAVTGNLDVTGNVSIGGNVQIGDVLIDSINPIGKISSDVIPQLTGLYDIGTSSLRWNTWYGGKLVTDDIEIDANQIRAISSNQNLDFKANGTGRVLFESVAIKDNIISTINNQSLWMMPNGTGSVRLQKNTAVTGNLDITGNVSVGGNVQLGDVILDTITPIGQIASNLTPDLAARYDIGSSSMAWRNLYFSTGLINDIAIDDNLIRTTISNADLELRANGTGSVRITDNFTVNNNFTSLQNTNINNANITGVMNTSSAVQIFNTASAGEFYTGDILINDNYITTTQSNSNLELRANGSGGVQFDDYLQITNSTISNVRLSGSESDRSVQFTPIAGRNLVINSNKSLQIPIGNNSDRVLSSTGEIRFNNSLNTFEGFITGGTESLYALYDIDRNTGITAELTPGANDNTIRMFVNGTTVATVTNQSTTFQKIIVDEISIDTNIISTWNSNADLVLDPAGTGVLRFKDSITITNNIITNIGINQVTNLTSTGDGIVSFYGTTGVVFPSGDDSQRPGSAEIGMLRYNTQRQLEEVFNGVSWLSVSGTENAITEAVMEDLSNLYALIFG